MEGGERVRVSGGERGVWGGGGGVCEKVWPGVEGLMG